MRFRESESQQGEKGNSRLNEWDKWYRKDQRLLDRGREIERLGDLLYLNLLAVGCLRLEI